MLYPFELRARGQMANGCTNNFTLTPKLQ